MTESTVVCSNRTFMELKLITNLNKVNHNESSNRTFMELKSKHYNNTLLILM